ncbi:MAG TPA: ornithine cyclodeaminase family protein [Methylibium sp.]|uniref:ornithine cyclodeaminase family protein n=1 Tax=Methylibium sp. TaxID=2067992 RepID=UPI002DBB2863|nr:ornithine cyclodeaminase family protein [Methylibium sp.]HEU4460081.1 ornithine cyclodeaminase family protein [Methylibium sp.]
MLTLTDHQIASILDFSAVVKVLDEAFADLARDRAAIHTRQRTDIASLRLSTMGAIWAAREVAGVKVYPTVAGQFSFSVLLFDLASNTPLALLDGNELTRFRTAAITALAASRMAKPAAAKLALFGAGLQGRSQAMALVERFRFEEIHVVDPAAPASWCEELQAASGARVRMASAESAVRDADIVVTATRSASPVFDGRWLAPGAFVSAIGTSTPKNRELDDATMTRAARIVVEWKPQCLTEAGEVALWVEGRDLAKLVDLPALYREEQGWAPASPDDITVFKSVGVGLADVATAMLAVDRARRGGAGAA